MAFTKVIKSNFIELKELEEDIVFFMKTSRIPVDAIYDLKIVLHEYLLNVMEHGYKWDSSKIIEVFSDVEVENKIPKKIIIKVKDFAEKFEISKEIIESEVNKRNFRGRGLLMISTFVDEIIYNNAFKEGNEVTFVKNLNN